MISQNEDLRFLLVNLTHISYRTSDTQARCSPEEIYEFLKFLNKFATSHTSQCVCYLSHKILTRIILQYPSLFTLFGSCNTIFQSFSSSTLRHQTPFWKNIYFVQILQSLLSTSSSAELTRSVVSYLYSQRHSFIESYFTEHIVLACNRMELRLSLFESLLLLIRTLLRIQKTIQTVSSAVKEDTDLANMINQICSTFLFSTSVTEIYSKNFMKFPFERVFYCGFIDLTNKLITSFAFKDNRMLDEITQFAISENRDFISNLDSNPLNITCTRKLTLRLDTQERYIKIITNMVLLCLKLFKYFLVNNSSTLDTNNNCTLLLNRISYLISVSRKTRIPDSKSQSDSTNSSLFSFYSQDDKSLFKFMNILLDLHSFLAPNQQISSDVKLQIYRTIPEPNELFLSFLIHTGFDHVLLIDLVTSELNPTFVGCFTTFLENLILFNHSINTALIDTNNIFNSLHLDLSTYRSTHETPIADYSTTSRFIDVLYKLVPSLSRHISKNSNKCVGYLISLLKELITKYDLCGVNILSQNVC